MQTRRIYNFGQFSLDVTAKVLLRGSEPVKLSRKAVETLIALAENSGRVLTKDELIAAVWQDRIVDEANLTQNIAVVRKALAAERGSPAFIETFPGRGYRLVGPVHVQEHAGPAPVAAGRYRWGLIAALAVLVVAAGVWLGWLRRTPAPAPQEFHRSPVTRLAGKEYQPVVSPDGSKVAFVWEQGPMQPVGLWVQAAGESSPRRVGRPTGRHSSPAWSPDGESLAYLRFSETSGEVLVTPASGGAERVVTTVFPTRFGLPNRHLDWSPDGQYLVINDCTSAREPLALYLVSVATGQKRRLTQPDSPYVGDVDPRFSPDGRWIGFTRAFHRAWQELFVMPAGGGTPKQITSDGRQVTGHDWAGGGDWIVFGSDRDGEFKAWKIRPHAADPAKTLAFTGIFVDYPLQLSMARRAGVLVYSVLQQDRNVWRLDLKDETPARWMRVIASPVADASPQYSPAGDRIVFRSDRSGEEQLWVCGPDGSNPVPITSGRLRPSVGRWSPDGRSIAFNDAKEALIFIATQGADGHWTTRATGVAGIHPVFSPDGKWIYAGRKASIIRVPAAGGEPVDAAPHQGISLGMSADGRSLYFMQEPAGTTLWKLDLASGAVDKVLDGIVPYCSSCWAPAPGGIYYLGIKHPDQQAVFFHDLATGRNRLVVDYPEPLQPIGSGPFSLSPDGRYLLCVRVDPSNSDINRMEGVR